MRNSEKWNKNFSLCFDGTNCLKSLRKVTLKKMCQTAMISSQIREGSLTKEEDGKQARGNFMRKISAIRKHWRKGRSNQERRIEDG